MHLIRYVRSGPVRHSFTCASRAFGGFAVVMSSIEPQPEIAADLACMFSSYSLFHVSPQRRSIDTYALVHAFLKERSHKKAASALKKAATGIVTIDDNVQREGSTLLKILKEWRELKAAASAG
jgi:hypothetical protein